MLWTARPPWLRRGPPLCRRRAAAGAARRGRFPPSRPPPAPLVDALDRLALAGGGARAAPTASAAPAAPASLAPRARWLLLSRREDLGGALHLEAAALAPRGSVALARALVACPAPLPAGACASSVSIRAELLPLAAAAGPAELLPLARRAAAAVRACLPAPAPPAALADVHYEAVERSPALGAAGAQAELHGALRAAFGPPGALRPRRAADGALPQRPPPPPLRVACVETAGGLFLGLVTQAAPAAWPPSSSWALAPTPYCAGVKADLAAAALGAALRAPALGARVLDPCCGSGGVLHAAWLRGARAEGGDCVPAMAATAEANLAAFEAPVAEAHRGRLALAHERLAEDAWLAAPPRVATWDAAELTPEALGGPGAAAPPYDACVSNLPHGRMVHVGGRARGDVRALLAALRPLARAHAFLAPAPLRPVLAELGYRGVAEVSVCRSGRRFLAVAYGDDDADGVGGTGANVEQLCLQLAELAAPSRESRRLGLGSNCSKE